MELTPLELAMKSRVRRHMLTALAGIVAGVLLATLAGASAVKFFGDPLPRWTAIFPVLGILTIPAVGFWSTRRNLRCPACEQLVAFQVSAMYSAFGAQANKHCNHCGQKIFADNIPRNFKRMLILMMGVAFTLGIIGAIAAALTSP